MTRREKISTAANVGLVAWAVFTVAHGLAHFDEVPSAWDMFGVGVLAAGLLFVVGGALAYRRVRRDVERDAADYAAATLDGDHPAKEALKKYEIALRTKVEAEMLQRIRKAHVAGIKVSICGGQIRFWVEDIEVNLNVPGPGAQPFGAP